MLQPVSARPAITAKPSLGAFSAPPGASATPVAPDSVSLASSPVAEAPEPPATRSWLRMGVLAAAAVAGLAGMVACSPPAPAAPAASVVKTLTPAASQAPVTMAQEDCGCAEARPEVSSSRIGSPTVRDFTGEKLKLETSSGVETKTTGSGQKLEFRWTHTSLTDAQTGDSYAADDLTGSELAFREQAGENWSVHATMQPAGNTGRFASVAVRVGGQLEEGRSTERATFRTYDRDSGNQVRLDELLAPHDFESVLGSVQARLGKADATGFRHDAEALKEHVAQSFTITEQGGRTTVTVGIPEAQPGAKASVLEIGLRLAPGIQL